MGRTRLLVLTLGIPGLLLYGTLATAQWRGNAALSKFTRLQKEQPADSTKTEDPTIAAQKRTALALAARIIPEQSEPAYQAALQNLVLAESESLNPTGPLQALGEGLDAKVALHLRDALRSINRAIALNSGKAEYHFVKATILQNLQADLPGTEAVTVEDAVASLLTTADRLDPHQPSLHYRIGSFQMALENREGAKKAFSVALVDSEHYARPIFELLWSSVEDAREIGDLVGSQPLSRALFADFLWRHGYKEEAKQEYSYARTHSPIDFRTGELLVQHGFTTGDYQFAREVLSAMEKQETGWPPDQLVAIKYYRGQSFFLEKRYQQAVASFEEAISLDLGTYYLHEALGAAFMQVGDYDRAIARYRFLLEKTGNELAPQRAAQMHVELARAYERKNRFVEALKEYFEACRLDPQNDVARQGVIEISRRISKTN